MKKNFQIFLCHANEDQNIVSYIYNRLETIGVKPWMDKKDIKYGSDWDFEIHKAIKESDMALIFLSTWVFKRGYIQKEFRLILDVLLEIPEGGIFAIPVRLEDCEIPRMFARLQWFNFFEGGGDEKLLRIINEHIEAVGEHKSDKTKSIRPSSGYVIKKLDLPEIEKTNKTLLAAALIGNVENVKAYLKYGASPNVKAENGNTALHLASVNGHIDLVSYLLQEGAEVDSQNNQSLTPLHCAASKGHLPIVMKLLEYKADVKALDDKGRVPLYQSLPYPHVVKYLLQNGANPNARDNTNESVLRFAVETDSHLDSIDYLLEAGVKLNENHNILHAVIKKRNWKTVQRLLSYNPNFKEKDSDGKSPLFLLLEYKANLETFEIFLQHKADFSDKDGNGNTILHHAVRLIEDLDILKLLLKNVESIDAQNSEGKTPLHLAVARGKLDIITLLKGAGANVNLKDKLGNTPLHIAIEKADVDALKLLLSMTTNVNEKNNAGETPLHIAVEKGKHDIIILLKEAGADANSKNGNDDTPIHIAVKNGHPHTLKLLLSMATNVNEKNNAGQTPLHIVVSKWDKRNKPDSSEELLNPLLDNRADVDEGDKDGYTVLHMAKSRRIFKRLRAKSSNIFAQSLLNFWNPLAFFLLPYCALIKPRAYKVFVIDQIDSNTIRR